MRPSRLRSAAPPAGVAVLVVVAFALTVAGGRPVESSSPPTMLIDPADTKVVGEQGSTFTLDVLIEDITDLGGFEFEVHYDEIIVNASVSEGPFLASEGGDTACVPGGAEGIATLACVVFGKPGVDGSGVLGQVAFTFKEDFGGKVQVLLVGCGTADSQGVDIPINGCKDAQVTANAPTPTPPPAPAVGGRAFDVEVEALPADGGAASGGSSGGEIAWFAALGAALGLGGWLVRQRLRRR